MSAFIRLLLTAIAIITVTSPALAFNYSRLTIRPNPYQFFRPAFIRVIWAIARSISEVLWLGYPQSHPIYYRWFDGGWSVIFSTQSIQISFKNHWEVQRRRLNWKIRSIWTLWYSTEASELSGEALGPDGDVWWWSSLCRDTKKQRSWGWRAGPLGFSWHCIFKIAGRS